MAKPKKCITPAEAKKLFENWESTRAKDIERAMGSVDTCEFTMNIDDMMEYLQYIKDQSKEQGNTSPGVRLYFAAYDDAKSKKATIFLSATDSDSIDAANNYKIDAWNWHQGGWPPNGYTP